MAPATRRRPLRSRSRTPGRLGLLMLCGLLAPAPAPASDEKTRADTEAALQELDVTLRDMGRSAYYRYCAACHGLEAKGHGIVANALSPRPPDLTTMARRRGGRLDRQELVDIVDGRNTVSAHGSRDMPVWGERFGRGIDDPSEREDVAKGRIKVIVHYLLSIQEPATGDARGDGAP